MKVLLDTNVLLDVLLRRSPHDVPAVSILAWAERGELMAAVSANAITTIHYIAAKTVGAAEARRQVDHLLQILDLAPVTRVVLNDAVKSKIRDFEDAVVHESARHASLQGIVTRNVRDFAGATLRIYSPGDFVTMFHKKS